MTGKNNTNANTSAGIGGFVNSFVAHLEPRQRDVIFGRYGLDGQEPVTLQAIGDRYDITRERVRQIEAAALATLRPQAGQPYFSNFVKAAMNRLKSVGGAEREESFLSELQRAMGDKSAPAVFANSAKFLLELSGDTSQFRDNYSNWHPYWYLTEADRKRAESFAEKFAATLTAKRETVMTGKFDEVFRASATVAKLSEPVARTYLALSRRFGESPFGDAGLMEWSEVNPKTARDWAYLILKREKKPLHFTELATMVARHRKGKRTNMQTIHNELIKDNRFVLVGRGLYSLAEHGYIPGTAKEIIAHILKKHGPLPAREVVSRVKDQRFLKEGTILINLQNKKHFMSMPDGRYAVREA